MSREPRPHDSPTTRSSADSPRAAGDCRYVVTLHMHTHEHEHEAVGAATGRLAGRLEHVASGRRHDFDTGAALLGCLVQEQEQVRALRRARA